MCLNRKKIISNGHTLYVDCGVCPACRQKAASRRKQMIEDNLLSGYVNLFFTLTYDNRFVPYIRKSDIYENLFCKPCVVPVYRDFVVRRVRVMKWKKGVRQPFVHDGYTYKEVVRHQPHVIGTVRLNLSDSFEPKFLKGIRYKVGSGFVRDKDRIGICFLPDIQNFYKRLRINYERLFHKTLDLSSFHTVEYGPKSQRPHSHGLLRVKAEDEQKVRAAVLKSWKFGNRGYLQEHMQIAKDASAYVASYVNSHNYLSPFYENKDIRQKSIHSKFYGLCKDDFSCVSITQAFFDRDLHYVRQINCKGQIKYVSLLTPGYVVSHYFPKFKGFSKFTSNELYSIYKRPQTINQYAKYIGYDSHSIHTEESGKSFLQRFQDFRLKYSTDGHGNDKIFSSRNIIDTDFINSFDFSPEMIKEFRRREVSNNIDRECLKIRHDEFYSSWLEGRDKFIKDEQLSIKDVVMTCRKIYCARNRFIRDMASYGFEVSFDDYALIASQIWAIRSSNILKDSYTIPEEQRYLSDEQMYTDYDFAIHNKYLEEYDKRDKSKNVYNIVSCVQTVEM